MLDRPTRQEMTPQERVRDYIRAEGLSPGDRLPPERELVHRLGLSRSHLRRAFETLESRGALWRHVGKGTFVGEAPDAPEGDPLAAVARTLTPMRMMQARFCLEPALAREAAIHASAEAMEALRRSVERARAATSWAEYEAQDDAFHRRVAEASDNALLCALFDELNRARRTVTLGNVARETARPSADHSSFEEHEALVAAVAARDPEGAAEAMRRHLKSVSDRLFL